MAIEDLPIFCYYDVQRFKQFGAMDCANWYTVVAESGKKGMAMYPAMGRKHITLFNESKLVFNNEPRQIFKSIDYLYVVEGSKVYQFDKFYNRKTLTAITLQLGTKIWYATLAVDTTVYTMITDGQDIFVITENGSSVSAAKVTDVNRPRAPAYVAAFGNRFVVSNSKTPNFFLTQIDLAGDPTNYFTINSAPLFARASGIINQMAVLHNQLYIFCNFTTDVWANIVTQVTVAGVTRTFPWKINSSYNFDYGISDPESLTIGFGRMVWLAQNADGLVSFVATNGQAPGDISSQAINVLLENSSDPNGTLSPFLLNEVSAFIYQYENTIFYRASAGEYLDTGELDITQTAYSIEYNFETEKWGRVIEANGERNRIEKHVYYNNQHLVTVQNDPVIYQMSGNIYSNELRNAAQENQNATDAFFRYPMRYELVTKQLFLPAYAEFVDDYVQIDFVFGNQSFYKSSAPFGNTVFLVSEESTPEVPIFIVTEDNQYIIEEGTNTPSLNDIFYNTLFKPHIELYYSDDGGVTFTTADLREFSALGEYEWCMRWYELGASRNRCYKLVCVSSAPIVILGAVRNTRRVSGGGN